MALAALVVAARADTIKPFLVCADETAVMAIARAYETSGDAAGDTMVRLAVAGRCFRAPRWDFLVADVLTGPLPDWLGGQLYVVRVYSGYGRLLYAWTWHRVKGTPRHPAT